MPAKQTTKQMMPPKLRIKLANESTDLLKKVKLISSKKDRKFHLLHSSDINEVTYNKLMILFEALMKESYENSSWGWNQDEKFSEWKHPNTRIVIVTNNDTCNPIDPILNRKLPDDDEQIVAFMCFRFATGSDKNECALYVYELQVDVEHQRQGLGKELMNMAKLIGSGFRMDKVMLTVFRSNATGLQFYQKMNFHKDKSSPANNEADYTILSLKLKI